MNGKADKNTSSELNTTASTLVSNGCSLEDISLILNLPGLQKEEKLCLMFYLIDPNPRCETVEKLCSKILVKAGFFLHQEDSKIAQQKIFLTKMQMDMTKADLDSVDIGCYGGEKTREELEKELLNYGSMIDSIMLRFPNLNWF